MNTRKVLARFGFALMSTIFLLAPGLAQTPAKTKCVFFDQFKDNGDGTVTDPRNGLMWTRFAEGFTWNGSACVGALKKLKWDAAIQAAS